MKTAFASRRVIHTLAAIMLGSSMTACWVHHDDRRGYRHERWHNEDVYRHEDGRWYANRGGNWVVVEDVDIR
jgi:hypothetical protein